MEISPYPVQETEAGIEALAGVQAVFITNTAWGAIAVDKLLPKDISWNSTGATQRFSQLLATDRENYNRAHRNEWA